jgi:hypothetical protein
MLDFRVGTSSLVCIAILPLHDVPDLLEHWLCTYSPPSLLFRGENYARVGAALSAKQHCHFGDTIMNFTFPTARD